MPNYPETVVRPESLTIQPVMLLGGVFTSLFVAPAAIGDVISFSTTGSGSVGVAATIYDPNDNTNTADVFTDVTPNWNGLSPFDQTSQQQDSVGGETFDIATRLQLDASTTNGVTTMTYRETNSMLVSSGVDPTRDLGFSYEKTIYINFTTTGWTELGFINLSGGLTYDMGMASLHHDSADDLLYNIDYSTGSAVVEWDIPMPSSFMDLSSWAGPGSDRLLLAAGNWTLELNDSFNGQFDFNDSMDFDMQFSNFAVPGPGGLAGLLGLAAVRRRRRR
ncbi:MAG: hypothetical protein P8I44_07700 [Phycisphaerales bacterium]|nr:hypothetical protein [Phycisphaerales bacterium]